MKQQKVKKIENTALECQGWYSNAVHAIPHYFTNPAFFRIIYDLPHFPALFGVFRI